ncbi:3-deoxy-D-manno-octulosonic acid transferase [uncultured Succinatimonas sp.]|uniref:3-deoxy-D-manno-octulosonic acid transferase n=1 Tax=uncultured Succinatimonas sp. TaxID=1262973 RepID=UPI0025D088D1|nr:3-deoxy-D-manno-octulosonic acid transferase [uncultured Succinatimonas sp.]
MLPEKLTSKDLLAICLFALISFVLAFYYESNQIVSGDQLQMIEKGYHALMTGEFLPYGNEASTVGNVPGSLSSIVIGLPLIIFAHPLSPVLLLLVIRLIGYVIFVNALTLLFSRKTVVFGALLYVLNPWFLYDSLLYNPSYLSFGAALFLNMLIRLRRDVEVSALMRFSFSVVLVLAAGWCMQFHYSWPVLVALSGVLWLRKAIKVSYLGVIVGVALIALTLIPYFMEIMVNERIVSNPEEYAKDRYFGYGLVHVYPIFKALLYWLRFGSLLVTQKSIVSAPLAGDMPLVFDILRYTWLVLTQVIGGITVLISAYANYILLLKKRELKEQNPEFNFVREISIAAIVALIAAAAAATLTLNYWQIIILFAFALLPVLCLVERKIFFLKPKYMFYFAAFMVAMNFVSATNSRKFHESVSYVDQVNMFCYDRYQDKCALSPDELDKVLELKAQQEAQK